MSNNESISKEDLEKLSQLASLDLSDEEKEKFAAELEDIIRYFKQLNDLDTKDVKPMTHPVEDLKNIFREDKVGKSLTNEEALSNAKNTRDGFFKAPRIMKD